MPRFAARTQRWRARPAALRRGSCTGSPSSELFAHQLFVFCNDGARVFVDMDQLGYDTDPMDSLIDPYIVVYSGAGLPTDVGACIVANDDFYMRDSHVTLAMAAGEVLTVAASSYCPAYVAGDCTAPGLGTYHVRVRSR